MRKGAAVFLTLILAAGAGGGWYYYKNVYQEQRASESLSEGSIYVERVSDIMYQGYAGLQERYVGVVDPQESKSIRLDSDKKLGEIFVEEGDEVKPGTPLFSYDIDEMEQKLKEADLELEEMNNTLDTLKQQLAQLQIQASKAKPADQQTITLEILSTENTIHKQEYSISLKQLERTQLEKSMDNSIVEADMAGIVKSINNNAGGQEYPDYGGGSSDAFMTILATGDYRVKGKCNEMNIYNLYVGEEMLIYPRADETRSYNGVIERIDNEPAKENSNNGFFVEEGSETASKYYFYIKFTDAVDLMLGQHVVIMPNLGQAEEKTGLWIPQYYVTEEDDSAYVWSCDDQNLMEKRIVTITDRNEVSMEFQIGSGLTDKDYIAFPDETIQEGMAAVIPEEMME